MLVRIGDEQQELIDKHLDALKNKIVDSSKHEEDTKQVLMETLQSVLENLPHKAYLYASLMALVAKENASMASEIVSEIFSKIMKESFSESQDPFKIKNLFRWLGYMAHLGVIAPASVGKVCQETLQKAQQKDLALHAVLILITTESVGAKLK